jgi:hypothetical protein
MHNIHKRLQIMASGNTQSRKNVLIHTFLNRYAAARLFFCSPFPLTLPFLKCVYLLMQITLPPLSSHLFIYSCKLSSLPWSLTFPPHHPPRSLPRLWLWLYDINITHLVYASRLTRRPVALQRDHAPVLEWRYGSNIKPGVAMEIKHQSYAGQDVRHAYI